MRIKRFIASDMRTALRMVREEQGPDAVILSNRPTADGIEIVSATDYDEALVQQALQAAAPGIEPAARAARSVAADRTAIRDTAPSSAMAEAMAAASRSAAPPRAAEASAPAAPAAPAPSVRETLATRARAV
ncbi:MAG: flagellar biosynthesis protein FlhF, partial [Lysobacter spongiicola]|nr:flagellar biosynthesis protein FlhF [Lysobacter spongiicola]